MTTALLRLPAHMLRHGDVILFPATAVDGTPIEHALPLAVVIEAACEAPYLDDQLLTLTTEDENGSWLIDYINPLRMFAVARPDADVLVPTIVAHRCGEVPCADCVD
jgi:hypothetical protein